MSKQDEQRAASQPQPEVPLLPGGPGRPGGFGNNRRGPVVKPKNFKGTLKRIWQFVGTQRKRLTLVFIIILIDAIVTLTGPYIIGRAVDAMTAEHGGVQFQLLELTILALTAAYLTDGVLTFLQSWFMAGISQRIVGNLRTTLFAKLQKLPLSFFDSRPHGDVMSRLSNDIDNVSNTISQSTTQLMSGTIALVGSLTMMIVLSPLLTLATLITVPLVYLLGRTITRKTSVLFKEQQAQLGKLNGHIEETISGIHIVKAFNHEEKAIHEFDEVNGKLYEVGLKAQIFSGFLMPLLAVINNIGFAAVAIVGGVLAVQGHITVGVIASFLSYSRQFVRPLNEMANTYNILQSGVAGAERVFEVLDEKEEPDDKPGAIELRNPKGDVVFRDVSFGYRPDVPILKHVDFHSEKGSSTALVGPTGAGKTTIVNLVTRFYDVTEGTIFIDGRDIRDYTRDSLRRCFGIVLQDTYLFSGTIKENIKYGKSDASDEEVEAAARMANADAFIKRLPKQYETVLSENGGNLSQGQRQLLAIARVILAKPSILILDEATSSIDTRTELHIQDALLNIMKGRTSFIIAHRLNTIRDADEIMVIDHGEIVEQGSHDRLIDRQGTYYRMFFNQFRNMEGSH
ncbi:ABC transporter ATP-binding protein/permease [Paenibacillus doosanensis]|uniref:ABC transporter ATP-binding protein n=1 Tax=Paenibacillus konkukensis TaxID=2020716 RepID=A0ABY4RK67_9BACL|nr:MULTISPECIES: ABC transporter ATP-binding protein [Paenibacillus]MCS7463921.1 ABC transporter ATP-binding protein/permease [Paenibacillus doosanensis]UQZ82256.1 putative ABC transporter ATP-binding protein [Paenibacillus konkukensis]